jgi:hypothetical protein
MTIMIAWIDIRQKKRGTPIKLDGPEPTPHPVEPGTSMPVVTPPQEFSITDSTNTPQFHLGDALETP